MELLKYALESALFSRFAHTGFHQFESGVDTVTPLPYTLLSQIKIV